MINKKIAYLLILALLQISCDKTGEFYLGGIQVNEPDNNKWVNQLSDHSFNTVSVTTYAKQGDWNSANLWFEEPSEGTINEIAAAKKKGLKVILILRVALDHAFQKNHFLWHGQIVPKNDSLLNLWFEKYSQFVEGWARKADSLNVDVLGIGSELKSLTATRDTFETSSYWQYHGFLNYYQQQKKKTLSFKELLKENHLWVRGSENYSSLENFYDDNLKAKYAWANQYFDCDEDSIGEYFEDRKILLANHWRKLIRKTREIYSGKLTYAANFDNYKNVSFWDELDFIGINAYFKIRPWLEENQRKHLKDTLSFGWNKTFEEIETFRKENSLQDKPIIFTELGYTYRQNSTIEPWAHDEFTILNTGRKDTLIIWYEQPVNKEERALALEALSEVSKNYPGLLTGILYWKLSTIKSHEEIEQFMIYIGDDTSDPALESLKSIAKTK